MGCYYCSIDEQLDLIEKRDRQARTLSGGMRRRLSLALALVHDPSIVVLDEPEAGLDPQSRIKVRDFIRSLARHKTIIFSTHILQEVSPVTDGVVIINDGRIVADGRISELEQKATGLQTQADQAVTLAKRVSELEQEKAAYLISQILREEVLLDLETGSDRFDRTRHARRRGVGVGRRDGDGGDEDPEDGEDTHQSLPAAAAQFIKKPKV